MAILLIILIAPIFQVILSIYRINKGLKISIGIISVLALILGIALSRLSIYLLVQITLPRPSDALTMFFLFVFLCLIITIITLIISVISFTIYKKRIPTLPRD